MTPTVILTISDDPDAGMLAQQLLRSGCRVAVAGPNVGTLLDAVRGYGSGRAMVIVGDSSDAAEMARMRSVAEATLGPIDAVIPAGITTEPRELATVSRLRPRAAADRTRVAAHTSAVA